jgi:carbonic anhydrase/acetyltransferase-like protein (isoleucine patch superfamily)
VVPEGRRIEPGMLAMGIPARAVRPVTEAERERAARGVGRYQDFAREYAAAARAAEEGEAAGKGRRKI